MNKEVKITGIIAIIAALIVVVLFRPDLSEVWSPLLVILGVIFGVPIARQAITKRLKLADPGLPFDLTWDEIHAMIMGFGDGLALNRPERILDEQYVKEDYRDIIRREAWYYKAAMGVGRLIWIPILLAVALKITSSL